MNVEILRGDAVPDAGTLIGYVEELPTSGPSLYAIRCVVCADRVAVRGEPRFLMGVLGSVPVLTLDVVAAQMRTHWALVHAITPAGVACYFADGGFAWL